MTIGSIDTWLKAAADNKITTKNTWDAPIIDHFSNIEGFRSIHGINFQKATTTLDGCVKVYSTRVDTVMDDTFKLLGSLGSEEAEVGSRRHRKKGGGTLEKNAHNLDLKELSQHSFVEPTFFRHKETASIFNTTKISPKGFLVLREERQEEVLNLSQHPINVSGLFSEKRICPTLNEMNPSISHELFEAYTDVEESHSEMQPLPDVEQFELENYEDEAHVEREIEVTPFGYVKGWAGPGHWKMSRHPKKNEKKAREKRDINFLEEIDETLLQEVGDTLINPKDIIKRREVAQTLPDDFMFSSAHLYRFLIREGLFLQKHNEEKSLEQKVNDMSICEASVYASQPEIDYEAPEEMEVDLKNVSNTKMSRNLFLKYQRKPKKVDISKLQENILNSVNTHKVVSLKNVCREVPVLYKEKDSENISVHYCVLSMLFLAQERNLEIDKSGHELFLRSIK